jgi:hypothetical protein
MKEGHLFMQALLQDLKNARKAGRHLFFNPLLDRRLPRQMNEVNRLGGVVESLKLNKVFL